MTENTVPELQHRTVLLEEAVDALAIEGARAGETVQFNGRAVTVEEVE